MAARWGRRLRWIFLIAVLAAVGFVAFSNRKELIDAFHLIGRGSPALLLAAVGSIACVYVSRGSAYKVAVHVMGYDLSRSFLARTALVATSVHQLIPTGGASGYAFLAYAFHQRGISTGRASIVALLDTLSYALSLASLAIVVFVHLIGGGTFSGASLGLGVVPAVALLGIALGLYYLQRERERMLRFSLRAKERLGALLGRHWADDPVRHFVYEYYEGKRVILENRHCFVRMMVFQYAAIAFDSAALYLAFVALGLAPNPWTVFVGFVVAMAGVSVIVVPGGGGSFEVVMSSFFATHGIGAANGIAAALLYRLAAFWIPVLTSLVVLWRLRRRRNIAKRIEQE
ncbi:MAG TPA: lysylphosphatidylglycerol synthase transmembrane domain-containing protein [Gammaproteobacteria bacterium]|nr:lysylphosphatidylglycerol synthase transmembrane domain-containing protein [Gammaproteobacteria bacterium]